MGLTLELDLRACNEDADSVLELFRLLMILLI